MPSMIDRYLLRYFLSVIDQGNFSKAAAACNVSQPTLSVGIAKLERAVGRALFHRTNRRVELTEAGARLTVHARRIEAEFAIAEQEARGSQPVTTIRLGMLATTPTAWTESFLRNHRLSGVTERVEITEGRERDLLERLARGRIDVALAIIRDDNARFESRPLWSEGYSLAVAADHRLAGRETIAAEELAGETMIVRRQCELLGETSRHFTARGVRPFFAARTTSDDRALAYVRTGLGITVMPDCFAGPGIARPRLADFLHWRTLGLLYAPHTAGTLLRERSTIRLLIDTIDAARV